MPKIEVKVIDIPVRYDGITYPAGNVFSADEADVKSMLQLVTVIGESKDPEGAEKSVDKMKIDELKEHAALHEIDLGEAKTKPEILAVIKAAIKAKEGAEA